MQEDDAGHALLNGALHINKMHRSQTAAASQSKCCTSVSSSLLRGWVQSDSNRSITKARGLKSCAAGTSSLHQTVLQAFNDCVQLLSTTFCPVSNRRTACGWVGRAWITPELSVRGLRDETLSLMGCDAPPAMPLVLLDRVLLRCRDLCGLALASRCP